MRLENSNSVNASLLFLHLRKYIHQSALVRVWVCRSDREDGLAGRGIRA